MKLSFLKIRTKSQLKKNRVVRGSTAYTKVTTVGLLFSVEDKSKHELVKEFARKLEHDGKKVQVISYLPKQKENYDFLFDFFTLKDISIWGNLESETALRFSETSFDYLYCLDLEPNPFVLNILARSKAKCRAGIFAEAMQPFFELMIDCRTGVKGLIDGLYKYSVKLT